MPLKEWSCNKVEDFIQELTLFNTEIESSNDEVGNTFRWFQQVYCVWLAFSIMSACIV